MSLHAAVDFGASSGRVMLGAVGTDHLELTEAARFRNGAVLVPRERGAALYWDMVGLWRESLTGLQRVAELARAAGEPVASVGVATWAVDYGLLDGDGTLLAAPRSYRDARTDGVAERLHQRVPAAELYRRNGLQHLPFTTVYQLLAEQEESLLASARSLLLLPDLVGWWLSGHRGAESTNVSTTGLADVHTGRWAPDLVELAGIDPALLAPEHDPGVVLAGLRPEVEESTGLDGARLVAVGSHDTASAVVGVPAADERFAYVVCGTWSLVGVELEEPVLTEASLASGFTNERGVDGRIRYLHNVMGLWVLQGCLADWGLDSTGLPPLLAAAGDLPAGGPVIDVDDPVFLHPGPMVSRVQRACEAAGQPVPTERPAVVRCVLDSLAGAFARAVEDAVRLSGRDVDVVHVVGGGAQNALLCQLTADACGRPVLAGPVEATALGNVLVQARAAGTVTGGLEDLRALVAKTAELVRYVPGR
ncbi:rhamnulokinase family protein [Modestobacter marinus]|uniref:Carbohydrate kinase n=1 Tax=Modestobacter marinus TaxID=477641 RepID=A0A846LNK6_9ACTN|nr:rhamnulokinase family protein [Modestobacter marinus]NIH66938.1 rhamnulokinase [Modestobacter marinus]GGL50536.1 carbohydrate kinase [Modestobacter marinus]